MAPSKCFATLTMLMRMVVVFFCVIPIGGAYAQQSGHDESHSDHESAIFGHAAVYSMEAGVSNIIAIAGGAEEDHFAFMVVPTTTATSGGLEEAEEAAEAAWESFASGAEEPIVLTTGEPATPSVTDVYQIALLEVPLVLVPVEISDAGAFALFLEHGIDEVQVVFTSPAGAVLTAEVEEGGGGHDEEGHDEEGHDEEGHDEENHDEDEDENEDTSPATSAQWANALIAAAVVSVCSLVGLLVMMNGRVASNVDLSHACLFGSGALLTASLAHIVPEALGGLQSKYGDDLHGLSLHAGVALLIGITFGLVVHALLASSHSHSHGHVEPCQEKPTTTAASETADSTFAPMTAALGPSSSVALPTVEGAECGAATQVGFTTYSSGSSAVSLHVLMKERSGKALLDIGSLQSVCWTVIIGDLVHNFADGVTIGAAFLGCSPAVGWTVTASAVLHEVPHELADFLALIKGGMSAYQAAVYNFISALSAVAGVVLILALRNALTSAHISTILLVGAGSFLFVALSELVPEALEVHPETRAGGKRRVVGSQVRKLASFLVGALLIGIPLLFDQHCDAGHDGHDH